VIDSLQDVSSFNRAAAKEATVQPVDSPNTARNRVKLYVNFSLWRRIERQVLYSAILFVALRTNIILEFNRPVIAGFPVISMIGN